MPTNTSRTAVPALRSLVLLAVLGITGRVAGAEASSFETLGSEYTQAIRPLVQRYCLECHAADTTEGDLDLERFDRIEVIRPATATWQKMAEMLDNREMPPKDGRRMPMAARQQLRGWITRYFQAEARAHAGDPGAVVLRRLNNAQYTYTLRDLTGIDLQVARDFPNDGAAGEGFTNVGAALVMSPALLSKYLDAAKSIASHAVPLPDGMRFSPGTTPRDWTDEVLHQIKTFYAQFANPQGRLPLERYLAALLEARASLRQGSTSIEVVSGSRGLSPVYLTALWNALETRESEPSPVLDRLVERWRQARPEHASADAAALAAEVGRWQQALTRFQNVGHMKPWMVHVNPIATRQEMRFKFPDQDGSPDQGRDYTLYLIVGGAGADKSQAAETLMWERPRLLMPGRPDLALCDIRGLTRAWACAATESLQPRHAVSTPRPRRAGKSIGLTWTPWHVGMRSIPYYSTPGSIISGSVLARKRIRMRRDGSII